MKYRRSYLRHLLDLCFEEGRGGVVGVQEQKEEGGRGPPGPPMDL